MKSKLLLILLFTLTFIVQKPVLALENDLDLWTPIFLNVPVTRKVFGYFEVNPRIKLASSEGSDINQLLIRPAIGYKLNDRWSIWQGYAWIANYIPKFTDEHRLWQQIQYQKELTTLPNLTFISRFRFEERFIENVDGVPLRLREMIRLQYTLNKKKTWFAVGYDELFVHLTSHSGGPEAGIDQNRLFLGLNHKFNQYVSAEGGYLMQYLNLRAPSEDKLNHTVLLSLIFTTPQLIKDKQ